MKTMMSVFQKQVWLGAALLCFAASARADKDYSISRVTIEARLKPDGSMTVVESRTFAFEGAFSYAYRTIPLDSRVDFREIGISDESVSTVFPTPRNPVRSSSGDRAIKWRYAGFSEPKMFPGRSTCVIR